MFNKTSVAVAAAGVGIALALVACGGTSRPELKAAQVAQAGPTYQNPLDAVPGRAGAIYFTADGPSGPGVFVVSSAGQEPRPLAVGRPFAHPVGIAISQDEASLFVADAQAGTVFTVPVGGGPAVALPGSAGLAPQGLEVKGEQLYLSGVDPTSGTPAVLSMPTVGGPPNVLASGLVRPEGIAVADDGTVFVTDAFKDSVLRVAGGTATTLAGGSGMSLGRPAGLALSPTGSLLVSSVDPSSGRARVLILDTASGRRRVFDDVIGANHGAGGLHRSHDGRSFAWCDVSRSGRVYRVEP